MDFNTCLKEILNILNCSVTRLAEASELSPSTISRYLNGSRLPSPASKEIGTLSNGILRIAEMEKKQEEILSFLAENVGKEAAQLGLSLPERTKQEQILDLISSMVYHVKKSEVSGKSHPSSPNEYALFGQRLHLLMNFLEISNIKMARTLNVDSSLISRFRNGKRIPASNPELMESICLFLIRTAINKNLLSEMTKISILSPPQQGSDFEKKYVLLLSKWLLENPSTSADETLKHFLTVLNTFEVKRSFPSTLQERPDLTEYLLDQDIFYSGIDGLQRAVLRFLSNSLVSAIPVTLYLYSEESIDWIISSPEFQLIWSKLMMLNLLKGNQIIMLHRIDRNLSEMLVGIEKWLPLYMTGPIKSYYLNSLGQDRFLHTMFCSSSGHTVFGCGSNRDSSGLHYYYQEKPDPIDAYLRQFHYLLKEAQPLIRISQNNEPASIDDPASPLPYHHENCILYHPRIPVFYLPDLFVENKLKEIAPDRTAYEILVEQYRGKKNASTKFMMNNHVTDYLFLPPAEQFDPSVSRYDFSELYLDFSFSFTKEEFFLFLEEYKTKSELFQIKCFVITESMLPQMHMLIMENSGAYLRKTNSPVAVFHFQQPHMTMSMKKFLLASLETQSGISFNEYYDSVIKYK